MIKSETCADLAALRQEGDVYRVRYEGCRPPSGGSCLPSRTHTLSWVTDMALLTEGGLCSGEIYKHGPPDGGRLVLRRRANSRCSGASEVMLDNIPDGAHCFVDTNLIVDYIIDFVPFSQQC